MLFKSPILCKCRGVEIERITASLKASWKPNYINKFVIDLI